MARTLFFPYLLLAVLLVGGVTLGVHASEFEVLINEIHYHPSGGAGAASLEFLELHNFGTEDVDISLWAFTEGIDYVFAPGTTLPGGGYLVVSPDPDTAREHYGIAAVAGPYLGRLDNGGEIVALVNGAGQLINRLHYDDERVWTDLPDGLGPSLEFTGEDLSNDLPARWMPSVVVGGTPGERNTRYRESPLDPAGADRFREGIINEILASRDGAEAGFVELHNPTAGLLDLSGFRLVLTESAQLFTLPPGSVFAPGALHVYTEVELGFAVPDRDEDCLLTEPDGRTLVDALHLEHEGESTSFGRFPDGDEDTFVMTTPTPGSPNSYAFSSPVVINEIYYHPPYVPASVDCTLRCSDAYQWVELWNRSNDAVDLSGWKITKGISFTFDPGTSLAAGQGMVVVASLATFREEYPDVTNVVGNWSGRLSHASDTLNLRDALGNRVDHVHYGDGGPLNDKEPDDGVDDGTFVGSDWPVGADGEGFSLELLHFELENKGGLAWRASTAPGGTPGARNSVFTEEPGPVIRSVRHDPLVPRSTDSVRVTCRIASLDPVTLAEVDWIPPSDNLRTVSMVDNGSGPDDVAGDGVFSAVIPPRADGEIVRFRIRVRDSSGSTLTLPREPPNLPYEGFTGPYYLYEVDDSTPPETGSPLYRIILAPLDLAELQDRDLYSDVLLPATVIAGDDVWYLAGLRYRGETSRREDNKSYRIDFPAESLFEGTEHLNLNAANDGDPDMSTARETLAVDLFRRAGQPYPQTFPVTLRFSGGVDRTYDSRYVRKENLDTDFLDRYFGGSDEGNLYRGLNPDGAGTANADLSYLGPDPEPYRPLYDKRSNEAEDDYSDVIALTRVFDPVETPDELFADELESWIDAEEWAQFFAIQALITNNDGGIWNNNGEDFFLYRVPLDSNRPDAGRFLIVTWDLNEAFDDWNERLFRPTLTTVRRFLTHPRFAHMYYRHLAILKEGVFSRPDMRRSMEFLSRMYPPEEEAEVRDTLDDEIRDRIGFLDENVSMTLLAGALSQPVAGTPVISPGDPCRFFRGSSPVPDNWTARSLDDSGWEIGPTGIGYGDGDDATELLDMEDNYTTVFIRQEFQIADISDIVSLTLLIDYDDAFAAYLNGRPLARSWNAPEESEDPISEDDEAGGTHEAGEPETYEIPLTAGLLVAGRNVFAVVALNNGVDSSDLSLIPSLYVNRTTEVSGSAGGCGGPVHATGSEVLLGGEVDPAVAQSVRAGGVLADLVYVTSGDGPFGARWSATVPISPGENRILVDVFLRSGGEGQPLESREVLVWGLSGDFTQVGGELTGSATWTAAGGPYRLTETVTVPSGSTLWIRPGAVVTGVRGAGIRVRGTLEAEGTANAPVIFDAYTCDAPWGGIHFESTGAGTGDALHLLRHCEFVVGTAPPQEEGLLTVEGSRVLVEKCRFRDLHSWAMEGDDSRIEISDSSFEGTRGGIQTDSCTVQLRTSLLRNIVGNQRAIDLFGDGADRSLIESCTVEGGRLDGMRLRALSVDLSRCTVSGVVESAVFTAGSGLHGVSTLSESILTTSATGLLVSDRAEFHGDHNTITANDTGVQVRSSDPAGLPGGTVSFHSAIIYQNRTDLEVDEASTLDLTYSDAGEDGPWPGTGNISAPPLFLDPTAGDYSLIPGSPCIGAGRSGSDMGAVPFAGGSLFLRGDSNGNGETDISDAVATLNYLFIGGPAPVCRDAADATDDGVVDITDAIYTLNFLFLGGPQIPPPYPEVGADPTEDDLLCEG